MCCRHSIVQPKESDSFQKIEEALDQGRVGARSKLPKCVKDKKNSDC